MTVTATPPVLHSPPVVSPCTNPGGHKWRRVGRARGNSVCSSPNLMLCAHCAERAHFPCGTRHEKRCGNCSRVYRRRLARLAEYGASLPSRSRWSGGMLTLTAPGTDPHRAWVVGGSNRDAPMCGCTLTQGRKSLAIWNASASSRWNHLRTALRQQYPDLEFFAAKEVQTRGALHLHVIIANPEPIDVRLVQAMARRAGFGCVLDYAPAEPGSRRFAYYVSKYVTKDAEPAGVAWLREVLDKRTGEVTVQTRARYRPWSQSRDYGLTMAELRRLARVAAARAAAAKRDAGPPQDSGTLNAGSEVGALFPGLGDSG